MRTGPHVIWIRTVTDVTCMIDFFTVWYRTMYDLKRNDVRTFAVDLYTVSRRPNSLIWHPAFIILTDIDELLELKHFK
jgi:hypothetical protein